MPPLKAGALRSRGEIALYMSTVICPACGEQGLIPVADRMMTGGDEVVVDGQCPLCNAFTGVTFCAGPGWGTEPIDAMHLAVGDQPSRLLPESFFRDAADRAVQRMGTADPRDDGMMRARARAAISYLLELSKFRIGRLEPADRASLETAIDILVSRGESVPADIARLVG